MPISSRRRSTSFAVCLHCSHMPERCISISPVELSEVQSTFFALYPSAILISFYGPSIVRRNSLPNSARVRLFKLFRKDSSKKMAWNPPYNPHYYAEGQVQYNTSALPPGYPAGSVPPVGQVLHRASPYPPGALAGVGYPAGAVGSVGYPAGSVAPAGVYSPYPPQAFTAYPNAQQGFSYAPHETVGFVFQPTDSERSKKKMEVKYSPGMDKYVRSVENHQETTGWRTMVYAEQNIQRKVEEDWKKAYLARQPGTVASRIEWRFDLSRMGQRVKHLKVHFPTQLYEDGQVYAYVAADNGAMIPLADSTSHQEVNGVHGCQRFSIIAELTRGKGEHSWQHAQLFRQELKPGFFSTDDAHYPFRVSIDME